MKKTYSKIEDYSTIEKNGLVGLLSVIDTIEQINLYLDDFKIDSVLKDNNTTITQKQFIIILNSTKAKLLRLALTGNYETYPELINDANSIFISGLLVEIKED